MTTFIALVWIEHCAYRLGCGARTMIVATPSGGYEITL